MAFFQNSLGSASTPVKPKVSATERQVCREACVALLEADASCTLFSAADMAHSILLLRQILREHCNLVIVESVTCS